MYKHSLEISTLGMDPPLVLTLHHRDISATYTMTALSVLSYDQLVKFEIFEIKKTIKE